MAEHGEWHHGYQGYVAVDDFQFVFESDSLACPTRPEQPKTTTTPETSCADSGLLSCASEGECYSKQQRCDFYDDCFDGTDEKGCPQLYTFSDCESETGLDNCGWEEIPQDDLDFVVANGNDTASSAYPIPVDRGEFLWIKKTGDDVKARAHVESVIYQNSRADCYVMFYYIKTGQIGSNINPSIRVGDGHDYIVLDNLPHINTWTVVKSQIGQRKGEFRMVFDRPPNNAPYDAGVAIDDVSFVDCHMPRPTIGECEQMKPFQCDNKVCLEFQFVCDLTDDCGDGTDEKNCQHVIKNDFEDDNNPFGIFHEQEPDKEALHWERGSGMTPNPHTGPSFDHTFFTGEGHYLYLTSGKMVNKEEKVLLVSKLFDKTSEDGPDCMMTMYYHMFGAGLGTLEVAVRHGEEMELLFSIDGSVPKVSMNSWKRETIVVKKSKIYPSYIITIEANVLVQGQGDIGLDDIVFGDTCTLSGEDTSPTSTTSTPAPCDAGSQFTCGDGSCIPLPQVCNFQVNCPNDAQDEATCPDLTTFETCDQGGEGGGGPSNCGWTSSVPDTMNWEVVSLSDLEQMQTPHRPMVDFENKTSGHFLYVRDVMGGAAAGILSPQYQDSSTYCMFTFWLYMSGEFHYNPNFFLFPTLTHSFMNIQTDLDKIDLTSVQDGIWTHVLIGIGQHRDKFDLGFELVYEGEGQWLQSVAVDQVEFLNCGQPRGQDTCLDNEFHCDRTHACVDKAVVCDFADNCGDESDEDLAFQPCDQYTRVNFEDPLHPWGFFNESQGDFMWLRGNGSLTPGTGPPFDHTMFSPLGNYLYINSKDQEVGQVAWLTTPFILPATASDKCTARFFYHMHGSGVGKLTLYIQ